MPAKNFKQAAQMSLDDRWDKIVRAKTCEEMRKIEDKTGCELCRLQKRRHGGRMNSISAPDNCGKCGLRSYNIKPCCDEFYVWNINIGFNGSFPKALKAAQGIVKRLEAIAHGTG